MRNRRIQIGLGVPTILLIFVSLCMCILCTLTYLSAYSNMKSVSKEVKYVEAYYKGDAKAKEIIDILKGNNSEAEEIGVNKYIELKYEVKVDGLGFNVDLEDGRKLEVLLDSSYNIIKYKLESGD